MRIELTVVEHDGQKTFEAVYQGKTLHFDCFEGDLLDVNLDYGKSLGRPVLKVIRNGEQITESKIRMYGTHAAGLCFCGGLSKVFDEYIDTIEVAGSLTAEWAQIGDKFIIEGEGVSDRCFEYLLNELKGKNDTEGPSAEQKGVTLPKP